MGRYLITGYKCLGYKTNLWAQLCEAENKGTKMLLCSFLSSVSTLCFVAKSHFHFFLLTFHFFNNVYLKLKPKPTRTSLIESNPSCLFLSQLIYLWEKKKMSASTVVHNFCSVASCISNCRQKRTLVPTHHAFHSPNSLLRLKKQSFLLNTHFKSSRTQKPPSSFVVSAAQSNFVKG